MRLWWALVACVGAGCAPLAAQHQADAAFRKALAAQLADRGDEAQQLYREVISLGFDWSPVWNNLAVLEVHRHEYISARHLLAHAVEANPRDLVALTNYGVMSYYLSDFPEARRTLVDAQKLRRDILNTMPTMGRSDFTHDHWEHVTEPLAQVATKYLKKIDRAEVGAESPTAGDAVAALQVHSF
jgi:tetratricopeptide (TPR) repeat protein